LNKDGNNKELPLQCYAVLPGDGRLVVITQGEPGYTLSPLDRGDRQRNRTIADEKNKEFGGITPEQEKRMITGAVIGWEFANISADSPAQAKKIMGLEIRRPGSFGNNTFATVVLPATPYELADALDRARVTDDRVIYSLEILGCELDYLPQFISPSTNLYELNYLAQRLAMLNEWELDCFTGMVMMDTVRTEYAPIPVERLINMTYSMADCNIAYEAHDDMSLGKFYADNDFVPALENLPENILSWLDYGKIGKELREGEGGVFTPNGYVVQNGEIAKAYQSGDAIPTGKPDYTVLLRVTKGYFNDPEYDNGLSAILKLPADDETLYRAVEKVEAASPKECAFTAVDCVIPRLTEKITDDMEDTNGGSYDIVNELAGQLRHLDREGSIPTYKAMLEAAPDDISLEDALDLGYQSEGFALMREAATPADYAKAELAKYTIPMKEELFADAILYHYGEKLMEHNNATATDYGVLISRDGQTVEQCLVRPDRNMDLKENGTNQETADLGSSGPVMGGCS
jgi:hypothetical protein